MKLRTLINRFVTRFSLLINRRDVYLLQEHDFIDYLLKNNKGKFVCKFCNKSIAIDDIAGWIVAEDDEFEFFCSEISCINQYGRGREL